MIVYHGGIDVIKEPDINHSYRPLDFGKGFYITTVKEQAEKWAKRKADIFDKDVAVVNCYEMKEDIGTVKIKTFPDDLIEWIAFISQKAIDGLLSYSSSYEV
ncbi:MAG: DUF3990 domain-containing protein [Pseudobutyrivibrio sp.]|nr:DUF3990 domain-containing protein [Pseudobutyrivibrio sp.]